MIWLLTIVTFLVAAGTAMLVFVLLSRFDQVRAVLRTPEQQRLEGRSATRVDLEIAGPNEPLIYEVTFTENVSRHGARVVAKRRWLPDEHVFVKLPDECLPSRARITYCQPLKGDRFALGLEFGLAVYDWIGSPSRSLTAT
jgi:hypothetical protein